MAIKMFCELCGQLMGTIGVKDLKKFTKSEGEKCDECKKMEMELSEFVAKKQAYFNKRFRQLVEECRKYMMDSVEKLLEERGKRFERKLMKEEEEKRKAIIEAHKKEERKKIEHEVEENGE